MFNRITLGVGASLLAAVVTLGWLWRDAVESAQEAAQEAQQLEVELGAALDAERRTRELADGLEQVLADWQSQQRRVETELASTRRTLNQIRAAAREETADANLACAVRPVPADVDRLLGNQPEG